MGRSPGKWIRILMRLSKPSKSHLSKKKNIVNKEDDGGFTDEPPLNSTTDERWEDTDGIQLNGEIPHDQFNAPETPKIYLGGTYSEQEQHFVSKIQAAYRGYLARRAFKALKGITRLQAVVRGYLVRRQAVASFHCLRRIVKLQVLIRARRLGKVSKLYIPLTYVKIVVFTSVPKPLRLQYDRSDPNSIWSWLDRWSLSHFWKPAFETTTPQPAKSFRQTKPLIPTHELHHTIPKPTSRKPSSPKSPSFELEKLKTSPKKASSARIELSEENPHNELERVKRGLRKVPLPIESGSVSAATIADVDLNHSLRKIPSPAVPAVPKVERDANHGIRKIPVPAVPAVTEAIVDVVEGAASEKDGEGCGESEEVGKKEQRGKRRASFPTKNGVSGSPEKSRRVPSYMAATKSTKAKLRGQGSTECVGARDDVTEEVFVRRHSLPSSTLGIVRPFGKCALKPHDRTLSISRDDKVKGEWRR